MSSSDGCGRLRWKMTVYGSGASIVLDVGVPVLARVDAQLAGRVGRLAQHVERELHVLGRERLAVVPLHALAQEEDQVAVVVLPRPLLGELADHGVHALLLLERIEDHEVAEARHRRPRRRHGRGLVDGEPLRRVLALGDGEHAARLRRLRDRRRPASRNQARPSAAQSAAIKNVIVRGRIVDFLRTVLRIAQCNTPLCRAASTDHGPTYALSALSGDRPGATVLVRRAAETGHVVVAPCGEPCRPAFSRGGVSEPRRIDSPHPSPHWGMGGPSRTPLAFYRRATGATTACPVSAARLTSTVAHARWTKRA